MILLIYSIKFIVWCNFLHFKFGISSLYFSFVYLNFYFLIFLFFLFRSGLLVNYRMTMNYLSIFLFRWLFLFLYNFFWFYFLFFFLFLRSLNFRLFLFRLYLFLIFFWGYLLQISLLNLLITCYFISIGFS